MDTCSRIRYPRGYETPWNTRNARKATSPCCGITAIGEDISLDRREGRRFPELGSALATSLSAAGEPRPGGQADAGTATPVIPKRPRQVATASGSGTRSGRLLHRSLDSAAHRQVNPGSVWGALQSLQCLVSDGSVRVELPETGTSGHAEGRSSHRSLEEMPVAPDKKKPKDWGPISYSSMKAGSSSSLISARLGHRLGKRRSAGIAIGGIEFPRFPPSLSPPLASISGFIFGFIPPPSQEWRSSNSCDISCARFRDRWCCCGMEAPSIGVPSSKHSCANTSASMRIGFPPMPRSLIQTNSCGPKPKTLWPTAHPKIWWSSAVGSAALCNASKTPSPCFGPAFTLQICRGSSYVSIIF